MSTIEKLDSARIKQEKIPFTMHHNYVLQNIKDATALAIWCYLTSLPDDWKIHRSFLMNHFSIGRDKLFKALKFLHDNYLLEYSQVRNEDGVFGDSNISIKCGYEFEQHHRKLSTDSTAILKIRTTENPLYGKTAPTKEIKNTNKIKRESTARKKREPLSEDFKPDQERESKAKSVSQKCNISFEDLLGKFKTIEKKKNKTSTDWQLDFELFLAREKPNNQKPVIELKNNKEIKCTVPDFQPITNIKSASIETVNENMLKIKQILSRKMINGQSERESDRKKESRAR